MQLATTFRGLNRAESASATRNLERNMMRIDRLLERPFQVRAIIEGAPPEHRVLLFIIVGKEEIHAQSNGHELTAVINNACERLRNQLIKNRRRREAGRQKASQPIPI